MLCGINQFNSVIWQSCQIYHDHVKIWGSHFFPYFLSHFWANFDMNPPQIKAQDLFYKTMFWRGYLYGALKWKKHTKIANVGNFWQSFAILGTS